MEVNNYGATRHGFGSGPLQLSCYLLGRINFQYENLKISRDSAKEQPFSKIWQYLPSFSFFPSSL
jgi:hypothetical protein